MKKPRGRQPGSSPNITCTDDEWEGIRAGAAEAGMSVSAWAVHCALTVDPSPAASRRVVLDEKQQRSIPRAVGEHVRSLLADVDAPARFTDDLRALLKARLETMVRDDRGNEAATLLREVFGDERAETIAAALMPDVRAAPAPAKKPRRKAPRKKPGSEPSDQADLFGS